MAAKFRERGVERFGKEFYSRANNYGSPMAYSKRSGNTAPKEEPFEISKCGFIPNPGREPTFWEFARAIIDERWSGNHWDPGRNIECCSENFNKRLQDYRIMELARAAFNVTPLRSTLSAASARWNTTSFSSSRTTATRSATCCGPWDWVPQLSRGGKTGESGRQRRIRFCYFLV